MCSSLYPLSGVCYLLRLVRSIGKLKVSMHGPMNFATSVFSDEGKATQEQLSTKRAAKPKAIGAAPGTADKGKTLKEGDASVPAPPLPQSSPAVAAAAAAAVAAAPVAPKSGV